MKNLHFLIKNRRFWYEISSSGRSNVIFNPEMTYFATVPTSLSGGKVTSEYLVDDFGTTRNQRRSDPKVIILNKLIQVREIIA